ncbi:MAG: hypothetical protein DCF22_12345 [Leptolyngbya sp.]|nr:MAG: hypothetical protein DCF22_12345 [Leptolyngbya sp.]
MTNSAENQSLNNSDEPIAEPTSQEQETEDLPQEQTESYGTGVHDQSGFSSGGRTLRDRLQDPNNDDSMLTGIDTDAVGDEEVGGTAPTPDMDIVDELGAAVGIEMDDGAFLRTTEILEGRDDRRWELDPEASEDYGDRATNQ